MHKKLAADLTSLAHSILQMKDKEDVFALKQKAHEVYEKLSVLAYVEEYINTTPNPDYTKEELLEKVEKTTFKSNRVEVEEEPKVIDEVLDGKIPDHTDSQEEHKDLIKHKLEEVEEEVLTEEDETKVAITQENTQEVVKEIEEKAMHIIEEVGSHIEEEVKDAVDFLQEDLLSADKGTKKAPTLDDELKDTIAADVVADLFENATKKSLNDKLLGDIQIGLNDRIAFVKNLFGGNQEDFNRVVSQLNTFKTEKEAKKFINKMVKPDYDWTGKEEFEERFVAIVERKFA